MQHPITPNKTATRPAFQPSLLAQALFVAMLAAPWALPMTAQAQSAPADLGTVQAGTAGGSGQTAAEREKARQASAPHQAPTQGSLKAAQPQSIINQHYIDNAAAPSANYDEIISIAPSVVDIQPNGPGGGNSKGLSIRGFQDGQYNLTWDGIPVGDANDFTHHSAAYFMPEDIGSLTVDRGPGNASDVGYATFGGTISLLTKQPLDKPQTKLYGAYGSFGTNLLGAEFDTGVMKNYGDLRAFIDYSQFNTNGYLTDANLARKNVFIKAEKPVGDHSLLTFVGMRNEDNGSYNASVGATSFPYVAPSSYPYTSGLPGQIQKFGPNYGLNNNPNSQANAGYNYDPVTTDFEYLGLKTSLGDVQIDNKIYTYAYYHDGHAGLDPNGGNYDYGLLNGPYGSPGDGTVPAGAGSTNGTMCGKSSCLYPNNVPGVHGAVLNYRNWGDMLRLKQALGAGELRYGLWVNVQHYYRFQANVDITNGGGYNYNPANGPQSAIGREINGNFTTAQPYVEYAWHVTPQLTITPGLKYAWFRRTDDAPIEQKTKMPLNYTQTFKKTLPAIDLHYAIASNWTAYAQAAKGYLAPNENLFYIANPQTGASGIAPEETTNYQVGTTWRSRQLTVSGDLYAIDFTNQVQSRTIAGQKYFYNAGGTKYRGAEVEATYYVGSGFSLYGNAAYNQAKQDSNGLQLAGVPKSTGAAGVIYNRGVWYASLIAKYIGTNDGDIGVDAHGNPAGIYPIAAGTVVNAALNYTVQSAGLLPHGTKVGVQIFNLANNTKINALAGYTAGNVPLFYTNAGRSFMLNFSVPFQ